MTPSPRPLADLAGLKDATKPVLATLAVPWTIALDSGRLVAADPARTRRVTPPADLLRRFIALAEAPDGLVLDFARRFGLLGLRRSKPRHPHSEPLAEWRAFAASARATVELAAALLLENDRAYARLAKRTAEQIRTAGEPVGALSPDDDGFDLARRRADGRAFVVSVVNRWLALGDARPAVSWPAGLRLAVAGELDRPRLAVQGGSLLAVLATQLALAVAGADGLAWCSACRAPYAPSRRPAPGRRNYCPDCRDRGAPLRDAKRAQRERERTAAHAKQATRKG